jgi:hypothetical protein
MYRKERDCCAIALLCYIFNEPLNWRRFPRFVINNTGYELMIDSSEPLCKLCDKSLKTFNRKTMTYADTRMHALFDYIARNMSIDLYAVFVLKNTIGCNCCVYKDKKLNEIYIAFRGTDMLNDVAFDFKIDSIQLKVDGLLNEPGVGVHRGFLETVVYNNIHMQIINIIKAIVSADNMNRPTIYIVGHSLGGADAVLFGLILRAYCIKKSLNYCIHIHSYGCPVVGDVKLTEYINGLLNDDFKYTRVVADRDIIPRLSSSLFYSTHYTHAGHEAVVIRNNEITVEKGRVFQNITLGDMIHFIPNHCYMYDELFKI